MAILTRAVDQVERIFSGIGRRLARHGSFGFLDARQGELGNFGPVELDAIVFACATQNADFTFVQIGAHNGEDGDPLRDCIRTLGLRGVLVEPQAGPFEQLKANYADQPQLAFERAVIAAEDGAAHFYGVDPAFWTRHGLNPGTETQIASLKREQIRYHVSLFGGKALAAREDEYLTCKEVPAFTLGTLLSRHGLSSPDLMQIDAEGFDYEILKMIDWAHPPALVHYETLHLCVADRVASWTMLRDKGYRLFATNTYNTLAVRVNRSV